MPDRIDVISEVKEVAKVKEEMPQTYDVHICIPCKRLFRSANTLNRHRNESLLHIKVSYGL